MFFGRDWFLLDEQGATINGQLLHTATLPDNSDFLLLSAMESENVDTAQLIVLPFSQLNMLTANADAPMAYLSVFLQSGQGIDDVQRIADWLQSRHPSYSYYNGGHHWSFTYLCRTAQTRIRYCVDFGGNTRYAYF